VPRIANLTNALRPECSKTHIPGVWRDIQVQEKARCRILDADALGLDSIEPRGRDCGVPEKLEAMKAGRGARLYFALLLRWEPHLWIGSVGKLPLRLAHEGQQSSWRTSPQSHPLSLQPASTRTPSLSAVCWLHLVSALPLNSRLLQRLQARPSSQKPPQSASSSSATPELASRPSSPSHRCCECRRGSQTVTTLDAIRDQALVSSAPVGVYVFAIGTLSTPA
jgi:hypothetical protein